MRSDVKHSPQKSETPRFEFFDLPKSMSICMIAEINCTGIDPSRQSMIGIGGGLMFKGLKGSGEKEQHSPQPPSPDNSDVLKELAELRNKVNRMDSN